MVLATNPFMRSQSTCGINLNTPMHTELFGQLSFLRDIFTSRHEVSGLLSLVGQRLNKLNLMLEGRGQVANDAQAVVNDSQVI